MAISLTFENILNGEWLYHSQNGLLKYVCDDISVDMICLANKVNRTGIEEWNIAKVCNRKGDIKDIFML